MPRVTARGRASRRAPGGDIVLYAGREKPVRNRHPWVFSGGIESIGDEVENGGVADVSSSKGEFLARGMVNRASQIVVRLLTWDSSEVIDASFLRRRLERAIAARPADGAARFV